MAKVIKSRPRILDYDVEPKLEPLAEWLERKGLILRDSVGKVLANASQVVYLERVDSIPFYASTFT